MRHGRKRHEAQGVRRVRHPSARAAAETLELVPYNERSCPCKFHFSAEVAELADAQASGACARKGVKVRVLSSASHAPAFASLLGRRRPQALALRCARASGTSPFFRISDFLNTGSRVLRRSRLHNVSTGTRTIQQFDRVRDGAWTRVYVLLSRQIAMPRQLLNHECFAVIWSGHTAFIFPRPRPNSPGPDTWRGCTRWTGWCVSAAWRG